MECKLKDWGLGALSKLVWRAKLAWNSAVADPSSPSEVGERVNPSSTGNAGGTDTMVSWVGLFCENGAETWISANKISFPGHAWDILCNKTIATWSHQPSKPPASTLLGSGWVAGRGMTKVINGVQAEGLGPWGIK